jgi:hypothetical protein
MSLARAGLLWSAFAVLLAASIRLRGSTSDAQKVLVRPGRLETLFAADPFKEQKKRAAERAGASLRAGRRGHRVTVRSYSDIRTDLYTRHETSVVFLALQAKVVRTAI